MASTVPSMSGVPLLSASLASICISSLLYGIHLVLFVLNILLMMRSRDFNTVQSSLSPRPIYCMPNFITTTLLLAGNTFHWIVAVFRVYQAFILFHNGSEPLPFYSDLSQISELILTGALVFCVVVGDVMIIHRLWVVWGFNYLVVIFPSAAVASILICGIGNIHQLSLSNHNGVTSDQWVTANCVSTLCTNLYCTGMIAWKIWSIRRGIGRCGGSNLMRMLVFVVESAALYSSWALFFLVAFETQSSL